MLHCISFKEHLPEDGHSRWPETCSRLRSAEHNKYRHQYMQWLAISRQKSLAHGQESFKIPFLMSDPLVLHALYSYSSSACYVRSYFISNSTHMCALRHVGTKLITSCTNSLHDLHSGLNYWPVAPNVWVMITNNGL